MKRLRALLAAGLAMKYGVHRDTFEGVHGYLLRRRCVDCGRAEALGWVYAGVSNRRTRHPHA